MVASPTMNSCSPSFNYQTSWWDITIMVVSWTYGGADAFSNHSNRCKCDYPSNRFHDDLQIDNLKDIRKKNAIKIVYR